MLPPFYYKGVHDDGLVAYIDAIVAATAARPIPIYLYHFPAQSGLHWHVALIRRLLDTFGERIVGLKDSSGDMAYAREAAGVLPRFKVFPSTEAALPEARVGPVCRLHFGDRQSQRRPVRPCLSHGRCRRARRGGRRSASCSTASRWFPASRRCSPIFTASRNGRASRRRFRPSRPPIAPPSIAGYDAVRAKRVA